MKKHCIAMLLAGGQGSRLYALTAEGRQAQRLPFGGKYRIIDFPLSNCANSGIDTVGVLTQYQPLLLNSYIGSGQAWDLDSIDGGVYILPPYQSAGERGSWFSGTANAIYQNIGLHRDAMTPTTCSSSPATISTKWTMPRCSARTSRADAACTISVHPGVRWRRRRRFGIMNVGRGRLHQRVRGKARPPEERPCQHGHLHLRLEDAAQSI